MIGHAQVLLGVLLLIAIKFTLDLDSSYVPEMIFIELMLFGVVMSVLAFKWIVDRNRTRVVYAW